MGRGDYATFYIAEGGVGGGRLRSKRERKRQVSLVKTSYAEATS